MKFRHLISIIVIFITLYSCKSTSDEPVINPLEGLTKLSEGYAIGAAAKVELWGNKNFFVGYNNVIVVIYDSLNLKEKITDAHIHFIPVVSSGSGASTIEQISPAENPNETPINEVFSGTVTFVKASDSNNTWKLGIAVHNHKVDKEGEVILNITVDNSTPSLVKSFTSINADSTKFVLSLLKPIKPKEGTNELEFSLNENTSSLGWSTDDNYTVEINTEMPDMWYSSHSYIITKNIGNGHYTGSFDLSMGGEWRINVVVKNNGVVFSKNVYFTLNI
ncbi:MAG: FixH family protein [Paludibacter sp.]